MNLPLRDYQADLIEQVIEKWESGAKKVMAQLPTGGGKTVIFSFIIQEAVELKLNCLVLVHREELLHQAIAKLKSICSVEVGAIKAGIEPNYQAPVQVASVQTLVNRLDLLPKVDLIVVDEAHHSTANTYTKILENYSNAHVLGVTATPIRLDGKGFRGLYEELVCGITVNELINQGYLSKFRLFADSRPMNTKGVRTQGGDYSTSQLAQENNAMVLAGNLIETYTEKACNKRCLVFAINVEHSQIIARRYREAGIPAFHLDGETSKRDREMALDLFREGTIKVISNCGLFDEGLDIPALEAVQIAKPTKSLSRWLQMVGRVLRPAEGKGEAIILDHTKNWCIHGLPTRRRIWTLDGVEKPPTEPKEQKERILDDKPIQLSIFEQPINLTEIEDDEQLQWLGAIAELEDMQKTRGYKPGWLYYQLVEMNPPEFVWEKYAQHKGYKPGWVKLQLQNLKANAA